MSFIKFSIKSLDFHIKYKNEIYVNNTKNDDLIFFEDSSFLNFIEHSLMLFSNKNNKKNTNELFELISNKNNIFNFNISIYKGLIIELLYYYIFNLIKINEINQYKNFLTFIEEISKKIIIYLIDYFKNDNYPIEKINNDEEELIKISLIVKYLMFLEMAIKIPNVNKIFSLKKNEIFLYIIIPNILNNSLEAFLFENNSKEYYQNNYDFHLNSFEIKTPKQKAFKILFNMCVYNENFFNFIINLYIKILFKLTSIENQDYFEDNNEIYLYLINKFNQEKLFENCLEVFTYIFYLILENQQKFDYFSKSLNLMNHILINIENNFLSTKLIIFYSHILPNFYNNEKFFIESLNFIFKCLLKINSFNYSLFYISLRAINNLIVNNSLKNLCLISIKNFINQFIFYIENIKTFDFNEEYYKFIKNIINKYLNYLENDSMKFIDFYWKKFENNLESSIKNNLNENKQLKKLDNEINISNNINIIKIILKNIKNNKNYYNYFFPKILNLTNFLEKYLNWSFEQEILEIITIILNNNFSIEKIYLKNILNYLTFFNIENENNTFKYKFEEYHIYFIYYFINCFKNEYLIEFKIKETILNFLTKRLLKNKISKENQIEIKIYLNFGLFFLFYLYDLINENDIQNLINLFYKTFNLIDKKSDLNNKLYLNILICLFKIENINLLDFLNINDFLNLFINYFQIENLSVLEKRIISISILKLLKYSILKGFEKIDKILITKLIKLNYDLLELIIKSNKNNDIIKQNYNNLIEKFEIKNRENKKVYEFNERKNIINMKKKLILNKFYDENENEKFLLEEKYENYDFNNEDNENINSDNMEIDINNDNIDEKLLYNKKLYFNDYYEIFAKNNFKNFIENINEFQLFFLFLNEIKSNDFIFFNNLKNNFNSDEIKNINEFKFFKKIELKTNDNEKCNFLFRKILKIKNKY